MKRVQQYQQRSTLAPPLPNTLPAPPAGWMRQFERPALVAVGQDKTSIAYSKPPIAAVSTIAGIAWHKPMALVRQGYRLRPAAGRSGSSQGNPISGMAWHKAMSNVAQRYRFAPSSKGYGAPQSQAPIVTMAWQRTFDQSANPGLRVEQHPSLTPFIKAPPGTKTVTFITWQQVFDMPRPLLRVDLIPDIFSVPALPDVYVMASTSDEQPPSLTVPAHLRPMAQQAPFAPPARTPISGMAWFQRFLEPTRGPRLSIEHHPTTFETLIPGTLPAPIGGMAWLQPFAAPMPSLHVELMQTEARILIPSTLPTPIGGMAWNSKWEIPPSPAIADKLNAGFFLLPIPPIVSTIAGNAWMTLFDQPARARATPDSGQQAFFGGAAITGLSFGWARAFDPAAVARPTIQADGARFVSTPRAAVVPVTVAWGQSWGAPFIVSRVDQPAKSSFVASPAPTASPAAWSRQMDIARQAAITARLADGSTGAPPAFNPASRWYAPFVAQAQPVSRPYDASRDNAFVAQPPFYPASQWQKLFEQPKSAPSRMAERLTAAPPFKAIVIPPTGVSGMAWFRGFDQPAAPKVAYDFPAAPLLSLEFTAIDVNLPAGRLIECVRAVRILKAANPRRSPVSFLGPAQFDPIYVGGIEIFGFDFTGTLYAGETVSSVEWDCQMAGGADGAVDNNAEDILQGMVTGTNSAIPMQMLGGFVGGVTYLIECSVKTSIGETIVRSAHVTCLIPS